MITDQWIRQKFLRLKHKLWTRLYAPLLKYQSRHQEPFFRPSKTKKGCTLIFVKTAATFGLFVHSWRASDLLPRLVVRDQWIMHKFTLQSYLATLIWPSLCGSRTVWPLSKDQNPPFLCTWCQVQKKYSHSQTRSALRPIVFAKFGRADGKSDDVGNRKTIRATHFSLVFFLPFLFFPSNSFIRKKKKNVCSLFLLTFFSSLILVCWSQGI